MADLYIDAWGDKWKLAKDFKGNLIVVRLKDGNIGGWQDGQGLRPIGKPDNKTMNKLLEIK